MSKRKTTVSDEFVRMAHALSTWNAQSLFELCEEGHTDLLINNSCPLVCAIRSGWAEGCKTLLLFNPKPDMVYQCKIELKAFEFAHVLTLWHEVVRTITTQLSNNIHKDLATIAIGYLEPDFILQFYKTCE